MIMSGRLCRRMILRLHIMHDIMLYTHIILHYAIHTHYYALCSWEILASGARWCGERSAIYISDRF